MRSTLARLCRALLASQLAFVAILNIPAWAQAPLSLDEALTRAIVVSPVLKSAQVQKSKAALSLSDVQSRQLQITAGLNAQARHAQSPILSISAPTQGSTQVVANASANLLFPLFTGFRYTNQVGAAEQLNLAAEQEKQLQLIQLRREVRFAYWNLYRAERLLTVRLADLFQSEKTYDWTYQAHQVGRATLGEVDQAELGRLNAEDALAIARQSLQDERLKLASLLEWPIEQVKLPENLPESIPTSVSDARLEAIIQQHPEVQAASVRVRAAKFQREAIAADYWPQLNFVSSYQHGNNPFDPTLSARRGQGADIYGTWDARLELNYEFFNFGQTDRNLKIAKLDEELSELNLKRSESRLRLALAQSLNNREKVRDRLERQERAVAIAERSLSWTETRYRQGYSLQIELFQSQKNLMSARSQLVEARVNLQLAEADLLYAIGM